MISNNTLQFQYFQDFNKFLQTIFSQLSFENFWLYLLGAKLFLHKVKIIICHILKSAIQRSKLSSHQMFQNVKTVQQRKPHLSFIRVIKSSSFMQSFIQAYLVFNLCRRHFLFHALNVSFCYQQQCNSIKSQYLGLQT